MSVRGPLSSRYDDGDRVGAWKEIHAIKSLKHVNQAVRQDIDRVAQTTMERAAKNISTIYSQLTTIGYEFEESSGIALEPRATLLIANELLSRVVALPPVIEAWLSHTPCFAFRGQFPWQIRGVMSDRNLLDSIEFTYSIAEVQSYMSYLQEPHAAESGHNIDNYAFSFAADFLHKNNISGAGPSYIRLPSPGADALVFEAGPEDPKYYSHDGVPGDEHGIWFVDYLRRYFRNGGFRRVPRDSLFRSTFEELAAGLLRI